MLFTLSTVEAKLSCNRHNVNVCATPAYYHSKLYDKIIIISYTLVIVVRNDDINISKTVCDVADTYPCPCP